MSSAETLEMSIPPPPFVHYYFAGESEGERESVRENERGGREVVSRGTCSSA